MDKLFPPVITNAYRGHPIAKWVLVLLTLVTIGRSLVHMFAPDGGAQSIASIPLELYAPDAANAVITLFALWGISQLLFGIVYVIVLARYQSLIPLMYLFIFGEYLLRLALPLYTPGIETLETAPGEIGNWIFVPLALAMLYLSTREQPETAEG